MSHPSEDLLIQIALGGLYDDETEEHLGRCGPCAGEVEELRKLGAEDVPPDEERLASLTAIARQLEEERSDALQAVAALEQLPASELENAVLGENAFHSPGGIQILLDLIGRLRRSDPPLAMRLGEIVLRLVGSLPAENLSIPRSHLQVSALREHASSRRALGDYDEALGLLEEAEEIAATLVVQDYEIARIWYERARTYLDRGDCTKAQEWAGSAAKTFALFGDQRRVNRARYLMAGCEYNSGNWAGAAREFERLIPRLEEDGDAETLATLWDALGHLYVRLDRFSAASEAFRRAIRGFRERNMRVEILRAQWGVARLLIKKTRFGDALASLSALRQEFESLQLTEEACLAGLDITEVLLLLGRLADAEKCCVDTAVRGAGRFSSSDQQRALAYLREIVEQQRLSAAVVHEVREYLYFSRFHPYSSFSPSGSIS